MSTVYNFFEVMVAIMRNAWSSFGAITFGTVSVTTLIVGFILVYFVLSVFFSAGRR